MSSNSKLNPFDVYNATYKRIRGHEIDASILIPANLGPGNHPLIVRWHGGFLIGGSRLFMPWFPQWILDYAVSKGAVLISPDYRLMPEASGLDILSDLADFWKWVRSGLQQELYRMSDVLGWKQEVNVDTNDTLVIGESAGGYLALQSALLHPNVGIKACIAAYPVIDIKSRFFSEDYPKPMLIFRENIPVGRLEAHIANTKPGTVVTADGWPPERIDLAICAVQRGRYLDLVGTDTSLFPLENLERANGLPAIWIYHGKGDSAVPVEHSMGFTKSLRKLRPDAAVQLSLEEGEHGLDAEVSLSTSWIKDGLAIIEGYWPSSGSKM
ncbi:hypothetical protein LTS18_007845 [Coniosporium uncinatum]|uniref:Uncharacterized protein n=1 Tax=Coniosporium uncinatum TaxID=93489 RepID=A0ACC3E071_9PEZI|nr:hypothetical protein LTS18_007845 [Coniosporium uncinatum]